MSTDTGWTWPRGRLALALILSAASTACGVEVESRSERLDTREARQALGSVSDAVAAACSTTSVWGLSEQVVAQLNCDAPGTLAEVPQRHNLELGDAVFPYMQPAARDGLVSAVDSAPETRLRVNSMLRVLPQQYLLHRWAQEGRCGIALAAAPGRSRHQSGLALDTSDHHSWRGALEAKGFEWFGPGDRVHFTYRGFGAADLEGADVRAFQRLWNVNHPQDSLVEDGVFGPATAKRLKNSPPAGFAIGSSCFPADAIQAAPQSDQICPESGCDTAETAQCQYVGSAGGSSLPMGLVFGLLTWVACWRRDRVTPAG